MSKTLNDLTGSRRAQQLAAQQHVLRFDGLREADMSFCWAGY